MQAAFPTMNPQRMERMVNFTAFAIKSEEDLYSTVSSTGEYCRLLNKKCVLIKTKSARKLGKERQIQADACPLFESDLLTQDDAHITPDLRYKSLDSLLKLLYPKATAPLLRRIIELVKKYMKAEGKLYATANSAENYRKLLNEGIALISKATTSKEKQQNSAALECTKSSSSSSSSSASMLGDVNMLTETIEKPRLMSDSVGVGDNYNSERLDIDVSSSKTKRWRTQNDDTLEQDRPDDVINGSDPEPSAAPTLSASSSVASAGIDKIYSGTIYYLFIGIQCS